MMCDNIDCKELGIGDCFYCRVNHLNIIGKNISDNYGVTDITNILYPDYNPWDIEDIEDLEPLEVI